MSFLGISFNDVYLIINSIFHLPTWTVEQVYIFSFSTSIQKQISFEKPMKEIISSFAIHPSDLYSGDIEFFYLLKRHLLIGSRHDKILP